MINLIAIAIFVISAFSLSFFIGMAIMEFCKNKIL